MFFFYRVLAMNKLIALSLSFLFVSAPALAETEFHRIDGISVDLSKCEKASDKGTYVFTDESDDQAFLFKKK